MAAAGGRRADRSRAGLGPLPSIAVMLLGAALAGAALFFLARAAIDFGQLGSDGEMVAWLVALVAALGAVVCLVLVVALVARVLFTLGIIREYKPRRLGARRRTR